MISLLHTLKPWIYSANNPFSLALSILFFFFAIILFFRKLKIIFKMEYRMQSCDDDVYGTGVWAVVFPWAFNPNYTTSPSTEHLFVSYILFQFCGIIKKISIEFFRILIWSHFVGFIIYITMIRCYRKVLLLFLFISLDFD